MVAMGKEQLKVVCYQICSSYCLLTAHDILFTQEPCVFFLHNNKVRCGNFNFRSMTTVQHASHIVQKYDLCDPIIIISFYGPSKSCINSVLCHLCHKNYDVINKVTAFITEFYWLLARQKLKFPPQKQHSMISSHHLLSKYINEIRDITLHFQIIYTNYSKQFLRVLKNTELHFVHTFSVIRTKLSNQLLLATRVLAAKEPLAAHRTMHRYRQLSDRIYSRPL